MIVLNFASSFQLRASQHLSSFVSTYDKPHTLLIVYYAGYDHSSATASGSIALCEKSTYSTAENLPVDIGWHEVDRSLKETSSDVLMIFDCSQAELLCGSAQANVLDQSRKCQYLGACGSEQVTMRAGRSSFTSATIWALQELSGEFRFSVTRLVSIIKTYEYLPVDQTPILVGTSLESVSRHICLEPTGTWGPFTPGFLDLRFKFRGEISEDRVIQTARALKDGMLNGTPSCMSVSFLDSHNLDVDEAVKSWKPRTRLGKERRRKEGREASTSGSHVFNIIGTIKLTLFWAGLMALENKLQYFIRRCVESHQIFSECWPVAKNGAVLVTTRSHAVASQPIDRGLEIKEFSVEDGAKYLLLQLATTVADQEDRDAALEISKSLNGYALALSQMAAYINSRSMKIKAFVEF